jgi:hypothetical protein
VEGAECWTDLVCVGVSDPATESENNIPPPWRNQ